MTNKLPPTVQDLENFSGSFLDEETIATAGIFRVTSTEGARLVGRRERHGSDYSGIVFPYYLPEQDEVRQFRLRRDTPDLERKNGELKEKGKYLSPVGNANMIYFPRHCNNAWLDDLSLPVVITEGEKKALALNRAAWHGLGDAAEKPRFLALGLSGVWNFKGVTEKTKNSKGKVQAVKGLIRDFDLIKWRGRTTTILYDANASIKESVKQARECLKRTLKGKAAAVFIADCPIVEDCNGIDDVLGTWERSENVDDAVERVLDLLESATRSNNNSSNEEIPRQFSDGQKVFHTPENEAYILIENGGHVEHHRVDSPEFKQRFAYSFYVENKKAPSSQVIQDEILAISGRAIFEGAVHEVHTRVAGFEGNIYVDLCNSDWQIVEITREGWRIIDSAATPVKFRRTKAMTALPTPVDNGDISKLGRFLNVSKDTLTLILAWLVNCFRPDYPYPPLFLSGEQGSAKSTGQRVLRELSDPSITPFRSSPRNEQDLIISACNSWVVGLDNLSNIPDWLSDALCRLSTGGGLSRRKLYTDSEEIIFNAKRPIIINGIGDLATRSDLLDRSLRAKFETIPSHMRRTEKAFWEEFNREKASIFSGLLAAISAGLKNLDFVHCPVVPRMADFAHWVIACEEGLGLAKNAFLNVYLDNRQDAHRIVLEDSVLAEVIQEYCEKKASGDEYDVCDLLLKDFLVNLTEFAGEKRSSDRHFPKTSRGLRSALERINPNLREVGIHITFHGKTGRKARNGATLSLRYESLQPSQDQNSLSNASQDVVVNQNTGIANEISYPNGVSDAYAPSDSLDIL